MGQVSSNCKTIYKVSANAVCSSALILSNVLTRGGEMSLQSRSMLAAALGLRSCGLQNVNCKVTGKDPCFFPVVSSQLALWCFGNDRGGREKH